MNSVGFDKCITSRFHHYPSLQGSENILHFRNIFTSLKIPGALHFLSFSQDPGNDCHFTAVLSCLECHVVGIIHRTSLESSFYFSNEQYFVVGTYHNLFIRQLTEGHLGCFQVVAVVNKIALNIHVQVFVWAYFYQLTWVNAKEHSCWVTWQKHIQLCKKPPNCLLKCLYVSVPTSNG